MKAKIVTLVIMAITAISCNSNDNQFDATGTFEAVETMVSAEANGAIKELKVEEGQLLQSNETVGYIDTIQLSLKKKQLEAQLKATLSRKPDIASQLAALREDLKQAKREQNRIANLVKADAATKKQYDDAGTQVEVIQKKIVAQQSSLRNTDTSLSDEAVAISAQIAQVNDQLLKSTITNPLSGTVITKFVEANEVVATGKPLYKIADLSTITLRAYISANQLAAIKLGQKVKVYTDTNASDYKEHEGIVEWISNKAEFTPKTIQTKEERANLVYAVKIRVKNDGLLKIGMYGEVKL